MMRPRDSKASRGRIRGDHVEQLNRELRAIRLCNQVLLRATNERSLLEEICRIICENAGYRMAWVGYAAHDEKKSILPVASHGHEAGYLSSVSLSWADTEEGRGPSGTAVRTGQIVWNRDIRTDLQYGPWREQAFRRGYRSSIAIPLKDARSTAIGCINIYSVEPNAFTEEEVALLSALANDLAFGILATRTTAERDSAQAQLRQLLLATEQSPASILVTDIAGNIEYVNAKFCEITGYSRDEVHGKNPRILSSHETPPEEYHELWSTILAGGTWAGQFHNRKRDGTLYWESATISPVRNDSGAITHFVAVKEDISEKKRDAEQIERQSAHLQQLFDNSPMAIVNLDESQKIVRANDSFLRIFQYTRAETIGKNVDDLVVPVSQRTRSRQMTDEALRSGTVNQIETERVRKDGTPLKVLASAYPIKGRERIVGLYVVYIDITEQRKLEQQLTQAQRLESLGTLAAGVAHDFNNILAIILGHASLLSADVGENTQALESVASIQKTVKRGSELVRQLMMFGHNSEVTTKVLDVTPIIREVERLIAGTFPRSITARAVIDPELPRISADATQLHQVLVNLCVNSRDAMPEGGSLTISARQVDGRSVRTSFSSAIARRYVEITVADTGSGMDNATVSRMFEPFFTTKEPGKGTGLGLSIVHGIVAAHGGFINAETHPGHGTTFFLYFPAQEAVPDEAPGEESDGSQAAGGSATILLIEDEEMLRDAVAGSLSAEGYRVVTAENGLDGIETYRNRRQEIDLVISSLNMPGIGGQGVAARIHAINPAARLIVFSGFLEPDVKAGLRREGVLEIIQKPCGPARILSSVRRALDAVE